ncbi:MAG: hypothetical protein BGN88_09410 [Clostridiales bacterium 43-6]|nr:MAG: hypothetical protein BGN88_09410 [Clostridiales bacterium 43-6]
MNIDKKKVGKRIREYREIAGINQDALSEMVDMSATSISNIERGRNFPSFENFIKIANAIKASPDLLLEDVIETSYKTKSAYLSDKIGKLPTLERQRILNVVESLIKSAINNAE